ncbi:MAG TPA: hypothetical protein VJN90_08565 [Candidatus Acidoferrales bacterium]|nr:hypothetical protein [Candidatus Acidoferrales bacterium]
MTGAAVFWNPGRCVGKVRGDDGRLHYVLRRDIAEDEVGNIFLVKGEPVEFELGHDRQGRPAAVRVRPLWREHIDLETYAGELCVTNEDARYATRPMGGSVLLRGGTFFADQVLLVTKFGPPIRPGQAWIAVDPQIVADSVAEYEAQECKK